MNTRESARRNAILTVSMTAILVGASLLVGVGRALASSTDRCARAEALLAATGRGDKDFDGISNCKEKFQTGTAYNDPDTDDDGVNDGDELTEGTDPLDPDTDGDGLDDGTENHIGTDPTDVDSDDDGSYDGNDSDPGDELRNQIEGNIESITCPTVADGSVSVLGIAITLNQATAYKGVATCADLAAIVATDGTAHVEVEVTTPPITAIKVHLEDADNNGTPDDIEHDGDGDHGSHGDGDHGSHGDGDHGSHGDGDHGSHGDGDHGSHGDGE